MIQHLGDITAISGRTVAPVEVIIGGSPCQDLSVAGKRAGLDGERSSLFMEQIRIIKEMRETYGKEYPRYMVWENVPGAFTSNGGEDFRKVLEETVRVADQSAVIPRPPQGKWRTSGCIVGDGFSVAWRVLDAQFWGVPQRRRRIALVADFGGDTAGEILFERKSVPGHPAPRGAAGEEAAGDFEAGADCAGADLICMATQQGGAEIRTDDKAPTLTAAAGMSGNNQPVICAAFKAGQGAKANGIGYAEECAPTLIAVSSGLNQCPPVLVFGRAQITSPNNRSTVGPGKPRPALHTFGEVPAVCYQMQGFGDYREGDVASSCKQRDYKDSTDLVVSSVDCRYFTEGGEINGTLQAKSNGGISYNLQNTVRTGMIVRRLTPMECERLQGYPDGWTDIGAWTDSKGKLHKESTNSARYRACGNSIALPPWRFILGRLAEHLERGATMASLFDGIGGFPLIWDELGNVTVWQSEIDEFCEAVTKARFG